MALRIMLVIIWTSTTTSTLARDVEKRRLRRLGRGTKLIKAVQWAVFHVLGSRVWYASGMGWRDAGEECKASCGESTKAGARGKETRLRSHIMFRQVKNVFASSPRV